MTTKQLTILLTIAALAAGQRPFFAGIRPIGYPEVTTSTVAPNDLGNRVGEDEGSVSTVSTTTQRLPAEANGNRELIEQLSKLPIDQQPFWFINWQAIEANRNKPQTYPQRPSQFAQPVAPNNPQPIVPSNPPIIANGNGNLGNRNSGPIAASTNAPLINKNGGDSVANFNTETKEPVKNFLAHNVNVADIRPSVPVATSLADRYGKDMIDPNAPGNYASTTLKPVEDDSKKNDEKVTGTTSKNPAVPSVSTPVKNNKPQNPLENVYVNSPASSDNPIKSGQQAVRQPVYNHMVMLYPNPFNPYGQQAVFTNNRNDGFSSYMVNRNPVPVRYTDDYEFETNIHPHGFKYNERFPDPETDDEYY